MLKVWGRKTSVNVQKVMWAVAELGLAHEHGKPDGVMGHAAEMDVATLNPNKLVPVIDDDGFVLWESSAIVRYLARRHGLGGLMPAEPQEAARADQWMDWMVTSLYPEIISTFFAQFVRVSAAERNHGLIDAATKRVGDKLGILERQLAGKSFILGDKLTVADIAVGALLYRYHTLPIVRPSLPNVEAYYQRLTQRKAYQDHVMIDWVAMKVPGA